MKHRIKSPQWSVSTSAYETELSPWRPCPFHSHEYADRLALSPGHWKEDAVSLESHKRMGAYAKDAAWLWHKKWSSVTWTFVYSLVKLIETDMMKLFSICMYPSTVRSMICQTIVAVWIKTVLTYLHFNFSILYSLWQLLCLISDTLTLIRSAIVSNQRICVLEFWYVTLLLRLPLILPLKVRVWTRCTNPRLTPKHVCWSSEQWKSHAIKKKNLYSYNLKNQPRYGIVFHFEYL